MDIKKIAFLDVYPVEDSVIMGAVMVTDADTKPLEFRVTSPVKPTNFQKILYGNVLREHILVELLAVPLLNALNEELDLILVSDSLFLGVNNKQDIRVVRVFNGNGISDEKNISSELSSKSGNGHASIEITSELEQELPGIAEGLNHISEVRDLLEPFDRLKQACEQVHLKKTKE